ncbi:MAG: ATP-binding protein [Myxococcaceae bacterium]|nr:ATP-binding protein [Myxococcaceae bacterium]
MAARRGEHLGEIEVIEAVDAIRRRPAMYVGSLDRHGISTMAEGIIADALDEFLAGKADHVEVDMDSDSWIEVRDNGAGLPLDTPAQASAFERWRTSFDRLQAGRHGSGAVGSPFGLPVLVVSALSEWFEISSHREERSSSVVFRRGRRVHERGGRGRTTRGTTIRFRPDPEIFGPARLETASVSQFVRQLAWLTRPLNWSIQGRRLHDEGGLFAAMAHHGPFHPGTLLGLEERRAAFSVELVLALAASPVGRAPRFETFANFQRVLRAPNLEAVPAALASVFPNVDPAGRLVVACHLKVAHPEFRGAFSPGDAGWAHDEFIFPEAAPVISELVTRALSEPTDTRIAWLEALQTG